VPLQKILQICLRSLLNPHSGLKMFVKLIIGDRRDAVQEWLSRHVHWRQMQGKILRDILIEATSCQKVCATRLSTGNQGGAPTLGQWPQCYRVWNVIEIFKISDKNFNYAIKQQCDLL